MREAIEELLRAVSALPGRERTPRRRRIPRWRRPHVARSTFTPVRDLDAPRTFVA